MKKNTRIIQISGFRGVIFLLIGASCLVAGFGIFPSIVSMYLWNLAASKLTFIPMINFFQGLLLWLGIAISLYMANEKNKYFFAISPKRKLSEKEVRKLLNRIKLQSVKHFDKPVSHNENKKKENV